MLVRDTMWGLSGGGDSCCLFFKMAQLVQLTHKTNQPCFRLIENYKMVKGDQNTATVKYGPFRSEDAQIDAELSNKSATNRKRLLQKRTAVPSDGGHCSLPACLR